MSPNDINNYCVYEKCVAFCFMRTFEKDGNIHVGLSVHNRLHLDYSKLFVDVLTLNTKNYRPTKRFLVISEIIPVTFTKRLRGLESPRNVVIIKKLIQKFKYHAYCIKNEQKICLAYVTNFRIPITPPSPPS